jgi:hypothetical protein
VTIELRTFLKNLKNNLKFSNVHPNLADIGITRTEVMLAVRRALNLDVVPEPTYDHDSYVRTKGWHDPSSGLN